MGVLEYSAERHIQVIKNEFYSMGSEDKEKELKPVIDELTAKNEDLTSENESLASENVTLADENAHLRKLLEENGIKL